MKKGLVFGKFMPVHNGHLALINFALSNCEQVIVSMSFTLTDSISAQLRFSWLKDIFKENPKIIIVQYLDDFNDENLPLFEATKLWAAFIKKEFSDVEAFFCSENYGQPLSFHLGIPCIYFDEERIQIPISATKIRQNPFQNWTFIPVQVKPYFIKKICLFGPESVGKTVLSQKLAQYFDTDFVHELARDLLISNEEISEQKMIEIGKKQTELVVQKSQNANKLLFCDTDVITTQIYAKHYLGFIPPILFELENRVVYDVYFLLNIDTEWVADPLRDLEYMRKEMFEKFRLELEKRNIPYILISGSWTERMKQMVEIVENILQIK
jgi:HTH-type transcriptional regulator, transcriptional repressor of NAD biosynthesis genes